jgi:hypothetical protein
MPNKMLQRTRQRRAPLSIADSAAPLARCCAIASAVEFRFAPLHRLDSRRASRSGYQLVGASALLSGRLFRKRPPAMLKAQQLKRCTSSVTMLFQRSRSASTVSVLGPPVTSGRTSAAATAGRVVDPCHSLRATSSGTAWAISASFVLASRNPLPPLDRSSKPIALPFAHRDVQRIRLDRASEAKPRSEPFVGRARIRREAAGERSTENMFRGAGPARDLARRWERGGRCAE